MNNNTKGLQLILTVIFTDRERQRLERLYDEEHERRVKEATAALRKELKRNGNNVLKASKKVFHANCGKKKAHCCSNDEFEKEVLAGTASGTESGTASGTALAVPISTGSASAKPATSTVKEKGTAPAVPSYQDTTLERAIKRELDRVVNERNRASYQLIQQHFARAHLKRHLHGDEALDAAERLLCDYDSLEELNIASDPGVLFRRVYQWIESRVPGLCRGCGKKSATFKCAQCGQPCFCSIACQVKDGANRVFCHEHECGLLLLLNNQ